MKTVIISKYFKTKQKVSSLSLLAALSILFFSCAKDRPFEEAYKEPEVINKSALINTEDTYIYVPSTLGVPRTQASTRAFFQGDEKLVKFKYKKEGLEAYEVDSDSRFSGNDLNSSPVITIPVTYKDYKCLENAQKECTQKEVENSELSWDKKNYVLPDYGALKTSEVNMLELINFDSTCASPIESKLINYEANSNTLNIEIERTFKVSSNPSCIIPLYFRDELKNASFKTRFFYSFVKLNSLAAKDFNPIIYPKDDQRTFGLFKTEIKKLNRFFDSSRIDKQYFANHWNPNRESIVFYLDKKFYLPENKLLLDATELAFNRMNQGLKKAEVKFKLNIAGPAKSNSGDIRYSMINLLDEPQESGLLGYGPSVANPLTGEIVQAHINMYSGVLIQTIRRTYESMIDLGIKNSDNINKIAAEVPLSSNEANNQNEIVSKRSEKLLTKFNKNSLMKFMPTSSSVKNVDIQTIDKVKKELLRTKETDLNLLLSNSDNETSIESTEHKKLLRMAKDKMCDTDLINFAQITKKEFPKIREISGILNNDGSLKNWDDLTDKAREELVNIILPVAYIQTLVHEVGHTLGLRHNFMGSFDKDNFYSENEAKEFGLTTSPAYSSIMDYSHSELNSLGALGKYDIAALRYAYTRKVEKSDGSLVSVPNTITELKTQLKNDKESLKDYSYCTDENAGLSARCNRFDEGSTLTEIALSFVDSYELGYKYRSYRNGRNEFNIYGIDDAVISRHSMFKRARQIFEEYEVFSGIFGKEVMAKGCSEQEVKKYPVCKTINDIKDASLIIASQFLEILKTPDLTCVIENTSGENIGKKEHVTLESELNKSLRFSLNHTPKSCFDSDVVGYFVKDNKKVIAQGGKYLNSIKELDPKFSEYTSDIAIRGFFQDKLLAMHFLTTRYLGLVNTEDRQGSLIDIPEVLEEIENLFNHIILGEKLNTPMAFVNEKGESVAIDYQLSHDLVIPEQANRLTKRYFGLPESSNVELNKMLVSIAKRSSKSTDTEHKNAAKAFEDSLTVTAYSVTDPLNASHPSVSKAEIDGYHFIANKNNVFAKEMIDSILAQSMLENSKKETVDKIIKIKNKEFSFPIDASEEFKTAANLPEKLLEQLMKLKEKNIKLTFEILLPQVGEEMAKKIISAYSLSAEQLNQVATFVAENTKLSPNASDEEKKIFNLSINTLNYFKSGKLKEKNQIYSRSLYIMAPGL